METGTIKSFVVGVNNDKNIRKDDLGIIPKNLNDKLVKNILISINNLIKIFLRITRIAT